MKIKKSSNENKIQKNIDRFKKIKKEIMKLGIFKKGTITKRWQTCGIITCKCKKDKNSRHGPYYWWTWKEKAKTKAILVPKKMITEIKMYIKNYKNLQARIRILEKISEEIIKNKIDIYKNQVKKRKKRMRNL